MVFYHKRIINILKHSKTIVEYNKTMSNNYILKLMPNIIKQMKLLTHIVKHNKITILDVKHSRT